MLRNDAPFRPLARDVRVRHRLFGTFFFLFGFQKAAP